MYKILIRPILFLFKAEAVHGFSFLAMRLMYRIPGVAWVNRTLFCVHDPLLEREVCGIKFPNPVGLAAGFDKDAVLIDPLSTYGFGFIEIGTVTPKPQDGNPKPRLFRLKKDKAIINRMGFNNGGMEEAVMRLKARRSKVVVGGNIGKNKITTNANAFTDYKKCFQELFDYVDYFVVNVSSPNTPGLRELQEKQPLTRLLNGLRNLNEERPNPKPIFLKIAPDLTDEQLDDIVEIVHDSKISGVIATNTTVTRDNLLTHWEKVNGIGNGGLSGKPLTKRSTEVIRYLYEKSGGDFPIIGVGGIMSEEDALEKIAAGATLVQVYSGFIYEGPALVKRINKAILSKQKASK